LYSSSCLRQFSFQEPVATQPVAVQAATEKEEEEEEDEAHSLRRDSSRKDAHFGVCSCMRKLYYCPNQICLPQFSYPSLFNYYHPHQVPWCGQYHHGPSFSWPHCGPHYTPHYCRHYT